MTKTEIALLRWGQLPMLAAIMGWILGFVGVAAGLWRPQWYWVLYFIATVAMTALCIQQTNAARERYIREAPLPRFLQRKLRKAYPQLSAKDGELVKIWDYITILCIYLGNSENFLGDMSREDFIDCVTDVNVAVGIRRTIVQNEFRTTRDRRADGFIAFLRLPSRNPLRFAFGQITPHREWCIQ